MIFFFSPLFHEEKQRYSTSVTAGHTIAAAVKQHESSMKGKKGNKGSREEEDEPSGRGLTLISFIGYRLFSSTERLPHVKTHL